MNMNSNINLGMATRPPAPPMKCTRKSMKLVERDDSFAFICNGCYEMVYGTCYHCICTPACNYHLHQECYPPSYTAFHHFFGQQSFILHHQPPPNNTNNNLCIACGMAIKGWTYVFTSPHASIFLHSSCIKLPHCLTNEYGENVILKKLESVACQYCERATLGEGVDGWAYLSSDQQIAYHVKCIKEMEFKEWKVKYDAKQQQPVSSVPSSTTSPSCSSTPPKVKGRKRRIAWNFTKVIFHFVNGDYDDAIYAVGSLFDN